MLFMNGMQQSPNTSSTSSPFLTCSYLSISCFRIQEATMDVSSILLPITIFHLQKAVC